MDHVVDGGADAASDAAEDAGPVVFPVREVPRRPELRSLNADIGPLQEPDRLGIALPSGFSVRVLATSAETVPGSDYAWHLAPDGGATFATEDGGWIYVSNAELPLVGGVGGLRFDRAGTLIDAYPILRRTQGNCAGGPTPWHTWLSCEEFQAGRVYECDPWGEVEGDVRPALGTFTHEAATVDPSRGHIYLSEDEADGGFYRFVPAGSLANGFPDLTSGELQIARLDDDVVTWLTVPDPVFSQGTPTRLQVASTPFAGGEGVWFHNDVVYLATKRDNRIWRYDINAQAMSVLYDDDTASSPILTGVDNITVSCCGDVLVAEDGGDMQVVAIQPNGDVKALLQVTGQSRSEITGPAFDPSGTRLYFSSQRGVDGRGVTYEVSGPFHAPV